MRLMQDPRYIDKRLIDVLEFAPSARDEVPQTLTPGELAFSVPKHEPTPDEIARKCAEIRKKWNATTERTRANGTSERRPVEVQRADFQTDFYPGPRDVFTW